MELMIFRIEEEKKGHAHEYIDAYCESMALFVRFTSIEPLCFRWTTKESKKCAEKTMSIRLTKTRTHRFIAHMWIWYKPTKRFENVIDTRHWLNGEKIYKPNTKKKKKVTHRQVTWELFDWKINVLFAFHMLLSLFMDAVSHQLKWNTIQIDLNISRTYGMRHPLFPNLFCAQNNKN